MAAGDVAGLVGHHADQLVGRFGLENQAGVDEQLLAAGREGVELRIGHQMDLHRPGIEPRGREHRIGVVVQDRLDLGVANDRDAAIGQGVTGGRQHLNRDGQGRDGGIQTDAALGSGQQRRSKISPRRRPTCILPA